MQIQVRLKDCIARDTAILGSLGRATEALKITIMKIVAREASFEYSANQSGTVLSGSIGMVPYGARKLDETEDSCASE